KKLHEELPESVSETMATGFGLSREECERVGIRTGGSRALKSFVDNAEALANLEFGGQKLGKDNILKILRTKGAAQAVQTLPANAEALANLEFGGRKLSKDDIVKILGNDGATQAVQTLLDKA
ncbi:hypothetical protein, partial [Mesorhizobium caraganae]